MSLKYGELFAGYGGLGLGVQSVLGGEMTWCAEFDKAPSKILAHHWPDVPNLGDVTKVDWSSVEPVDVITGGSPCQDLSHAGKRLGMKAGTRSGLWASMCDAIDIIRPRLVVWENVRGALSAEADSALEPCPGCVGDGDDGPVLRALGRVLGDLAELGYDAWWYGLRAADVGGAHGRFRIFVFAVPAVSHAGHDARGAELILEHALASTRAGESGGGTDGPRGAAPAGLTLLPTPRIGGTGDNPSERRRNSPGLEATVGMLLPTPSSYAGERGGSQHPDKVRATGHQVHLADVAEHVLLPTPNCSDANGTGFWGDGGTNLRTAVVDLLPTPSAADGNGGGRHSSPGHQKTLPGEARLLPTPSTQSNETPQSLDRYGVNLGMAVMPERYAATFERYDQEPPRWGDYAPAIARWEHVIGRPAPDPTEPGKNGNPRLSPAFVEWLMGLPAGHVTDPAIGVSRNDQLKALGNGVVPQQAAAATRAFIADMTKAVAS